MPRPQEIYAYFSSLGALDGIGQKTLSRLSKLCGETLIELLFHLPREVIDRRRFSLRYAKNKLQATAPVLHPGVHTLIVQVTEHRPPGHTFRTNAARVKRKPPYTIHCLIIEPGLDQQRIPLDIIYFHSSKDYLQPLYPAGQPRLVSGTLENRRGTWVMLHPDYTLVPKQAHELPAFEPLYPLTRGLTNRLMRKAIDQALGKITPTREWWRPETIRQWNLPDFLTSLHALHHPKDAKDLPHLRPPASTRLALDELLAQQLSLQLVRLRHQRHAGISLTERHDLANRLIQKLPFTLSPTQQNALTDIRHDLQKPAAMLRLLMGDVGSGKTIVALIAMLDMIQAKKQCALMIPSETLARQHAETLQQLLQQAEIDIPCPLLLGSHNAATRREVLAAIASDQPLIVIGTHALIQDGVHFGQLGMVVIDEQHRFGVQQRLQLSRKVSLDEKRMPETLFMSATPIPRSLLMSHYGDLEVTRLIGRNPMARPITTAVVHEQRLPELVARLHVLLNDSHKAFWVCPLREESGHSENANVQDRYQSLLQDFPNRTFLIHGAMSSEQRQKAMLCFQEAKAGAILVATTVIEVGIDIHDASAIVIESAQNFGLAQLHQLRGRVGRGGRDGHCILLHGDKISQTARQRLQMMRHNDDGFAIAEADLQLRGGGEILGTRQSGLPQLKLADITRDADLLRVAHDEAKYITSMDIDLNGERGQALRQLLYIFQRDHAISLLQSG